MEVVTTLEVVIMAVVVLVVVLVIIHVQVVMERENVLVVQEEESIDPTETYMIVLYVMAGELVEDVMERGR